MRLLLSGSHLSKAIIPACDYLLTKYLQGFFDVTFLNYGELETSIAGSYHSLGESQQGVKSWAKDLASYLEHLQDSLIVFALDDFLLSNPLNITVYTKLYEYLKDNSDVVTAKLGISPSNRPQDYQEISPYPLFLIHSDAAYTATTQYSLWRREVLLELLRQVETPWEFELAGSRLLNSAGMRAIGSLQPALDYEEESALHGSGNILYTHSPESLDLVELKALGLLPDLEVRSYTHKRDLPLVT